MQRMLYGSATKEFISLNQSFVIRTFHICFVLVLNYLKFTKQANILYNLLCLSTSPAWIKYDFFVAIGDRLLKFSVNMQKPKRI